jgi:hypothetical protein
MQAIKPISSSFAGALEVDLIRKERKNEEALSIIDLIEEFKEHYRMQQVVSTSTTPANSSAFATLQNNSNSNSNSDSNPNSNGNSNSNSRWNKKCICGLVHRFNDCYYIAKKKRP